jgi:uncharacterized protein YjbJ (UPF0337 family)
LQHVKVCLPLHNDDQQWSIVIRLPSSARLALAVGAGAQVPRALAAEIQQQIKEKQMNPSTKNEIKGTIDEVKGKIKETAGKVTNNPSLKAQGKAQQYAGKVEKKVGQVEKAFKK